jgi:hypothetical protein
MFELHITCTKDIDKLSIDFSDGTSIVQESKPKQDKQHKESKKCEKCAEEHVDKDILLDDVELYNNKCKNKKEVVKPLELPDIDRPVNVDNTLQNLEF